MGMPSEVDLRGLLPSRGAERLEPLLRTFEPGHGVVVLLDGEVSALLEELGAEVLRGFECRRLEEGDGYCAVELRYVAGLGDRALERTLAFDHRRLDLLLSEVEWRLSQRLMAQASVRMVRFHAALFRHLRSEERRIFPRYEALKGEDGVRIVTALRREHAVMRELCGRIARSLSAARPDEGRSVLAELADLRELLAGHARRVERDVAPVFDVSAPTEPPPRLHEVRRFDA